MCIYFHFSGNWTETTTGPDGTKQVRSYTGGLLSEAISYAANSTTALQKTTFGYNDLGQMTTQTESRDESTNLTTTMTYFLGGQLRSVLTPYDAANNTGGTVYTRDVLGRETSVRLPDGTKKTTVYNDAVGTVRVSGSQTYPSETKSDAFGQMASLTTWQNYSGTSGAAITKWTYDPPSGLLTSKQYADGNQTTYTYDAAGRLNERKWARGITTSYGYNGAGDLTSVSYTGGTPGTTFSYDRNGNQLTAWGSAGNVTYSVNPTTLLTESETVEVGNSTRTLVRTRDTLLRDTGFALKAGSATEAATAWTYDAAGRASTMNATSTGAPPQTFTYQWVAGRPQLIDRVVGPAVTVQNSYEPLRDVLASKENLKTAGGTLVSGYTYAVNSLGQRTSVQHAGSAFAASAFNVYGYDTLGQVTSAKRFTGGTPAAPTDPVAGQQFGFAYDTIGNRKTATDGNATTAYTPNALNQYTSVNTAAPTYDIDGNLLTDGTHTCEWDGENRLIKVTSGGTEISNAYDALSRRGN